MSSRAIRALRSETLLPPKIPDSVDEEEDDSDEENDPQFTPGVFSFLNDESQEESSDDEVSSGDNQITSDEVERPLKPPPFEGSPKAIAYQQKNDASSEKDEDIDALMAEFQVQDETHNTSSGKEPCNPFNLILAGLDSRHLDYDYVMMKSSTKAQKVQKVQPISFGPPNSNWRRPPRYVGGGIGMTTYRENPRTVPWPYNELDDKTEWFTYLNSDMVARDIEDFQLIRQSGDLNALGMFLAHHPFVPEALLQYSLILYQTNHMFEGMSLIKRCLWCFETAALASFRDRLGRGTVAFMDFDQPENQQFFKAIFRLMQVSHIAGYVLESLITAPTQLNINFHSLSRTALAASRLLLALDPLRDPMGVLLILDRHALAVTYQALDVSEQKSILRWFIDLVESDVVRLYYKDDSLSSPQNGALLNLCNWAYSYSLALFSLAELERLEGLDEEAELLRSKADEYLRKAMLRFPSVIISLLRNLEVDTSGRSFQRDWVKVLDFAEDRARFLRRKWQSDSDDSTAVTAALHAIEQVEKIFVSNPNLQWVEENTIQWFFDILTMLSESKNEDNSVPPPSVATVRYAGCRLSDFEAKNELLPADANIIDPNIIQHVLAPMQQRRQRFLRPQAQQEAALNLGNPARREQAFFGPPRNAIDLDWPMVEVFWRSFFPWNYVEGLPPPPRR